VVILLSALFLVTSPWFLYLNNTYKIITFIALGFILFIKEKAYIKILSTTFLAISLFVLVTSVVLIPEVKLAVDQEREWASNTSFSKLSGIYSNKYVQSFRTSEDLLFQNLDFGNYFFAGHPRERLGVKEIQKLYAATLILIFFGLTKIRKYLRIFLISFFLFAISLSVLLKNPGPEGNLLTLPVFSILGGYGLLSLIRDYGIKGKFLLSIMLLVILLEGVLLYKPF